MADVAFVAAHPSAVAAAMAGAQRWRGWFPDLRLTVTEDRGELGIRWKVDGAVTGTSEFWIEPHLDGSLLHYFLHAEPASPMSPERIVADVRERRVRGHDVMFDVKFTAEADRVLGGPAAPAVGEVNGV
ncbi:hypothetical protein SAMN04489765_3011 [Tsukamurella pulmonis]|uniref:Polyketide cyclase / dehydrase and lipid transport n=1 Tax=Tsukamurella pulmonis TaxID=47312 RepID=A0A1H1FZK9_9ACTN|nr:hypothetical protein SAMN04489765_3011 [Tsukamurella pulmonis]SUP18158.1 Uncharacterised protein [Tsukamurella pulmonis]